MNHGKERQSHVIKIKASYKEEIKTAHEYQTLQIKAKTEIQQCKTRVK